MIPAALSVPQSAAAAPSPPPAPSVLPDPARVLPSGWQSAKDRATVVDGTMDGLNVLVAEESAGYRWRTAATLSEPGYDADQWIGQACVTGDGNRAVVVYAPRTFTNRESGMAGGGFTAVVDLRSGAIRKLPVRSTLAYHSPGCGTGSQVAISTQDQGGSTVRLIDAATGAVTSTYAASGQVTSAVPYDGGTVGVLGRSIVRLGRTGVTVLATEDGQPFRLHPDTSGGLAYEVAAGDQARVYRLARGKRKSLGSGRLDRLQLTGSAGRVFVLGPDRAKVGTTGLTGWQSIDAPVNAQVSTTGTLAVTSSAPAAAPGSAAPVTINARLSHSAEKVSFEVRPADATASGSSASPALATAAAALAPGNDPTDPDRGCSMARNNPAQQAYQATSAQVEWAADLAVKGSLTTTRPANWNNAGNSPYQIQGDNGLFKLHTLAGGGQVPAQVLLGALAQESNTMHASPHAVDGETGNFNQGGFYGNWVSWSTVDCGYGIGQITTGMTVADGNSVWSAPQRLAIATDYAANIAASVNMMIDKWNQLYSAGILANGGDPRYIENWYLAAWAYNTGIQPGSAAYGNTTGCTPSPNCTDAAGHWGLGWSNNPSNPNYPVDRGVFNGQDEFDAKHPNLWPYPDKALGWAYKPVARFNYTNKYWEPAYSAASGPSPIMTGSNTFCNADDQCTPNVAKDVNGKTGAGQCNLSDLHCWWHRPVNWIGGSPCDVSTCGIEALRYHAGDAEPARANVYPTNCDTTALPWGAKIVDDVSVADPFGACGGAIFNQGGSFGLSFASATPSGCTSKCINYRSKIDFHQVGGTGFDGHFWFAHEITPQTQNAYLQVTGTWTLNAPNAWTRVLVHLPQIGAQTQQAKYLINLPNGQTKKRVITTSYEADTWVELGVYDMRGSGSPTVQLSNVTGSGVALDVAWDALAYVPLPAKPHDMVVALGDSYSSGEGTGDYYHETDQYGNDSSKQNACRRSPNAWSRQVTLPGYAGTIGQRTDAHDPTLAYAMVACSGALAYNVAASDRPWNDPDSWAPHGQYREVPQLDSGVVDENTTMVLLTIGGNDARFTDVLVECMQTDCTGKESVYEANIDRVVVPRVDQLLAEIHSMAPHALVVMAGYPHLFALDADLDGCSVAAAGLCPLIAHYGWALSPAETTMLNRVSNYMMAKVLPASSRNDDDSGTLPLDMISPFEGHNIAGWGDSGWLNALTVPNINTSSGEPTFSADVPVGFSSFHPNATGAREGYAGTATRVIASWYS
ncbi:SGNH/GDSL hydrolase family protein [Paractinoplanes toevensis]|uniref:SGNH/GDSL hydrolase family protein n=1 Tax=Paractinoplanes toevensis TaxID=571911 RepID=UPI001BB39362|nr:SGNH/GDSL hydrolase family protein [Actinoplanes toevensis]